MESQTYPIIKYPKPIQAFFRGDNPDIFEMTKPTEPHKRFSKFSSLFISITAMTISILIFNNLLLASIALFIIGILTFLAFLGALQEYQKEKKKDWMMFKAGMFDYDKVTKQQRELKDKLKDKTYTEKYIADRIKETASSASRFEIEQFNTATKGNSERYFYSELKKIFGDNVIIDVTIPNQQWTFPFIPDIVFSNSGITIDIEVDEPYTCNKLEPIHYFDITKQNHIDTDRDNFFNEHFWTVVRFTEKQVYENTLGCCKTVAEVIHKVTGDKRFLLNLNGANQLEAERFWTLSEAKELAKTSYRNSYNGTLSS